MVVGGATSLRYYVTDHLGSVAIVLDGLGAVAERRGFDAWGKSRNTNGTDDYAGAIDLGHAAPTRGFTDHEHIPSVGLVNMNARVYDPELGRFLSADSVTENIYFSQVLNRYSYVGNNPLSYTDMTGHSWLSKFLHGVLGPLYGPVVGILTSTIGWALGPLIAGPIASALGMGAWASAGLNAFISGAITGGISGGKALLGAIHSSFGAAANLGILALKVTALGFPLDDSPITLTQRLVSAGLSGFFGGLMSVARGDNFISGFLAAAMTDSAGPNCHCFQLSALVGKSVLGGFAAILGGGKFANGAVTAAFSYLYTSVEPPVTVKLYDGYYGVTHVTFSGKIVTEYSDEYYLLDEISKISVQIHELTHRQQLEPFIKKGCPWGCMATQRAIAELGRNRMELEAYQAQLDYLDERIPRGVPPRKMTEDQARAYWFRRDHVLPNYRRAQCYEQNGDGNPVCN